MELHVSAHKDKALFLLFRQAHQYYKQYVKFVLKIASNANYQQNLKTTNLSVQNANMVTT